MLLLLLMLYSSKVRRMTENMANWKSSPKCQIYLPCARKGIHGQMRTLTWTQTWTVLKYTYTFTQKFFSFLMLFLLQYSWSQSFHCDYQFVSAGAKYRLALY